MTLLLSLSLAMINSAGLAAATVAQTKRKIDHFSLEDIQNILQYESRPTSRNLKEETWDDSLTVNSVTASTLGVFLSFKNSL
ncbi:hypothetical protein NPIL_494481 [Nephila pilipes]|uniref:Uncharacterized protein n=1 Tax=Nephila pilipes TaxID=299642 RepID=A0A8X6U5H9_NEPPI|nr:hypothetical protein NPIL_494481 [Nephila pilipes]